MEWAEEDLQRTDPDRAATWNFQLTCPRVDAKANGVPRPVTLADSANGALANRVHKLMADWIAGGWDRSLDIHLEGFDECYLSASITGDATPEAPIPMRIFPRSIGMSGRAHA